jgi:hypothetical protein
LKRGLKIGFNTFVLLLLFFAGFGVMLIYALQYSEFQTTLTQRSAVWLSDRLGSKVTVGNVRIHWFDEIYLEDVNIKDLEDRDLIYVREVYVNCKTNFIFRPSEVLQIDFNWSPLHIGFEFSPERFFSFDNNLDFVMLREPDVKLIKEDGKLNIDRWIANFSKLNKKKKSKGNIPFTIDEALIENGTFEIIDAGKKRFPQELFDYNSFRISTIDGKLKDFFVQGDTIRFTGTDIKGKELRSGLDIKKIDTDFFYSRDQMLLENLYASINNSEIRDFLGFYYDGPSAFNKFNDKVNLKAHLTGSKLDAQDLGRFSLAMYKYKENYVVSGDITGKVSDLNAENLSIDFGKGSYLKGKAHFQGFPDVVNAHYDLDLIESRILAADSRQYSGEKVYTEYGAKFGQVDFSGIFKGTYRNFITDTHIKSSALGEVKGYVGFKIDHTTNIPTYNAELDARNIKIGELLHAEKVLEKVSFKGEVKGSGTNFENTTLSVIGEIPELGFNHYVYHNIHVDGLLDPARFQGNIRINDPNIQANASGKVDLSKTISQTRIQGKIERADLDKLGYSASKITLETNFDIDVTGNNLYELLGKADFENTFFYTEDRNLVIDRIQFNSKQQGDKRSLGLNSDFAEAEVSGNFIPKELFGDLAQLIEEYKLYFQGTESDRNDYYAEKKADRPDKSYTAEYRIRLKDTDDFFEFYQPDISISPNTIVSGRVRIQSTSEFTLYSKIDTLIYKGNQLYSNEVDFFSSKESWSPDVLTSLIINSEEQKLASNVETENLELSGSWGEEGGINFDGGVHQKNSINRAQLFGEVTFLQDGFIVKVNPRNSLVDLLDYRWEFDKKNQITVKGQEIQFEDFRISNKDQSIALSGFISPDPSKQLFAAINSFDLRALQPLAALQIEGIADGDVSVSNYYSNPILLSDALITSLRYKRILIGNVKAVIDWDNVLGKVKIDSRVDLKGTEIMTAKGTYDPESASGMDILAELDDANLEIFGAFVDNIFSDLKGKAKGIIKLTGDPRDPLLSGEVKLNDGQLRINATGSYLYFDDVIYLTEEGFVSGKDGFTVYDAPSNGRKATLEGGVFNGGDGNFMLGLHGYMRDPNGFMILNNVSEQSDAFYGTAFVGGDIHFTGDFSKVTIAANLTSKKNTKITIPLDSDASVNTNEEAIPFASKPSETEEGVEPHKKGVNLNGVMMAFNLTITPDAECEILFDRANNDKLNAFGNGRLRIEYDTRNAGFAMSGPFEVTSGKYDFSFQNLASLRKFSILEGSRITWSGDPYAAVLNVRAAYTANVDINGILLSDNLRNNGSSAEAPRYPVSVIVALTDQLETPTINYSLDFDKSRIPNRFQTEILAFEQRLREDERLLSLNVSTVIALNSLYAENDPLRGFDQQFLVDNLNSMLSNQIGNLANKLDPNLEFGVLLGDFRQNLLNNMQLNFSYRFLNDRIKLSGRSSYSYGQTEDGINSPNTVIPVQGQLTVGGELEYLLSEDGVWRLKVHSRSVPFANYTINFNTGGNVVLSGFNVLFSRNFNSFFRKPANKLRVGVGRKEEDTTDTLQEVSLNQKVFR